MCFFYNITNIVARLRQQVSIDSDDGLVLKSQQSIIWTNDDHVCWSIFASLFLNVLKFYLQSSSHIVMFIIWSWIQECLGIYDINSAVKAILSPLLIQFSVYLLYIVLILDQTLETSYHALIVHLGVTLSINTWYRNDLLPSLLSDGCLDGIILISHRL